MGLWARSTYIDKSQKNSWGDDQWVDTGEESVGRLFRSCQVLLGRCVSSMYVDEWNEEQGTVIKKIGWVFEKRRAYVDAPDESYLEETWVEVSTTEPKLVPATYTNITSPWQ